MTIKTIVDSAASHGSSELERVGYLDGWRGLAIAFVLQHHFFEVEWANFGKLGVDIFFCLSGLLMSRILFVKRVPLKIFYKRRISRILPSFIVYVTAVYGFAYYQGNALGWLDFASTLSFLRSYFPEPPDLFNTGYPLAHIWSLNVEEHCYVLLSLLTLVSLLKKREAFLLIALGCLSIGIHLLYVYVPKTAPRTGGWIKTEAAMSFLMISAGYALISARINSFVKPWMPIVALAISLTFHLKGPSWLWLCQTILSPFLLAFAVNHLAQTPNFFRNALASPPLRLLGISSYSIYLWQQPFYQYSVNTFNGQFALNSLFLAMAVVVGGVIFYCFENPSRTYLNKVW
jgi:peptidoglycan/LPS O-acetylase OafA/YrhL